MNGIIINLTNEDILLNGIIFKSNFELITPNRITISSELEINCYNGEEIVNINVYTASKYIKYPFTEDQIKKINEISQGRTRLFILNKQDAKYWSNGKFSCPFRNYRLFIVENEKLIEYEKPVTYLDYVSGVLGHFRKQLT